MQTELLKAKWLKPQIHNLDTSFTAADDCTGKSIIGEFDARCTTLGS